MELSQKPKTLFCYICGRQFGSSSLHIHLKSCVKKFDLQQSKKQAKLRIKCPEPPEELSAILQGQYDPNIVEIYNEKAIKIHKYKALPSCKFCGRTFNEQSLKAHEKGCNKKGNAPVQQKASYKIPQQLKKPRVLTCCVCGRQFGLTSLKIHYPQCMQKFKNQQKKKPKEQRKAVPEFSEELLEIITTRQQWSIQEIQEFNLKATGNYRSNAMVECPNCKRKFIYESFQKHKKNCVMINGKKGLESNENAKSIDGSKQYKKPRVLTCCVCGRQFGLTSLKIHYPQCMQKFKNEQKKKPKQERKAVPQFSQQLLQIIMTRQDWTTQQIQQFNSKATGNYREKAMVQCPNCKRKFIYESYQKHKKNCVMINGKKNTEPNENSKSTDKLKDMNQLKKPRVLMCHICGRQFGLTSLFIHQKQCEVKFKNSEKKKPKQERKPLPYFPENQKFDLSEAQSWSAELIDEFNEISNKIYRQESLSACPICGRKFFQQSLPKHLKHCQKNANKDPKLNKTGSNESMIKGIKDNKSSKEKEKDKKLKPIAKKEESIESEDNQFIDNSLSPSKESFLKQSLYKKIDSSRKKQISHQSDEMKEVPEWLQQTQKANKQQQQQQSNQVSQFQSQQPQKQLSQKAIEQSKQEDLKESIKIQQKEEQKQKQKQKQKQTEEVRNITSPFEKSRSSKGFAAPRKKQEQHMNKMKQCSICSRKFSDDKIQKHQSICKQAQLKQKKRIQNKNKPQVPEIKKKDSEENARDVMSPQEKVRENKGFAAKRMKQEAIEQGMVQCIGCGRKFNSDRIEKHQSICKKAKEKVEAQKFKNTFVEEKSDQKMSIKRSQCSKCLRKFAEDRLQKHMQICKGTKGEKSKPQPKVMKKQSKYNLDFDKMQEQKEKVQVQECQKCGRKFNVDRIAKHIEVCKGNSNKNIKEDSHKNIKKEPPKTIKKDYNLEGIEDNVQKIQLSECEGCKKKFAPERIQKHYQVCKLKKELDDKAYYENKKKQQNEFIQKQTKSEKPKEESKLPISPKGNDQFVEQDLQACPKCERKFKQERLQKHMQICKGQKKIKQKTSIKNEDQIRKTKNQFFKIAKDIKQKKIKDDDIDKQLDNELQQIQKTYKINRKQNKNRQNIKENKNDKSTVLPKI